MNSRLATIEPFEKNGYYYLRRDDLQAGDKFQGFIVGQKIGKNDRDQEKVERVFFQDESGEIFAINGYTSLLSGIKKSDAAAFSKVTITFVKKDKVTNNAGQTSYPMLFEVVNENERLDPAESNYGKGPDLTIPIIIPISRFRAIVYEVLSGI